ncbi:MAG: efflux RND transporter periplasmic adaptor subunit [Alphaproteobacteria bacterium]|nr:efflux RND transporter periplasmic adaptor subunit [Alphaproteobacteria bacterium]
MTRPSLKLVIAAAVVLALLGGGLFALLNGGNAKENGGQETATVARGDVLEIVTAQGKLEPKEYVDVGVQVSGQLKKLHADIGDAVKKGDLIAELDPLPYESRVAADEAKFNSLKAQVAQKKAQEELDRSQLKRAETLIKVNATSKDDLETKATALKVTQATVASLEAQANEAAANLESDKINLGYTKIYAPMDGIVADQIAREGQTLNANQTTPKIVQLADLNVMTVRAQIAEADVMRLRQGMEASFAPLGAQDRKWKGAVRQILPTPQIINDVVLYDALIDVANEDRQLMNGMSVQVFFEVARAENVLTLPVRFLGKRQAAQDSETGRAYAVKVRKGSASSERIVHAGLMTRTLAEIRDGLAEGDVVLADSGEANASPGNGKPKNGGPRPPVGPRL